MTAVTGCSGVSPAVGQTRYARPVTKTAREMFAAIDADAIVGAGDTPNCLYNDCQPNSISRVAITSAENRAVFRHQRTPFNQRYRGRDGDIKRV